MRSSIADPRTLTACLALATALTLTWPAAADDAEEGGPMLHVGLASPGDVSEWSVVLGFDHEGERDPLSWELELDTESVVVEDDDDGDDHSVEAVAELQRRLADGPWFAALEVKAEHDPGSGSDFEAFVVPGIGYAWSGEGWTFDVAVGAGGRYEDGDDGSDSGWVVALSPTLEWELGTGELETRLEAKADPEEVEDHEFDLEVELAFPLRPRLDLQLTGEVEWEHTADAGDESDVLLAVGLLWHL